MVVEQLLSYLNKLFPLDLQESYDNSGAQFCIKDKIFSNILIALDVDEQLVDYAVKTEYDLIITHHPLLFKPLSKITLASYQERILYKLIKHDISLLSLHTNLDKCYWMKPASLLNLQDISPLIADDSGQIGFGVVGFLQKPAMFIDLLSMIKSKFKCEYLLYNGDLDKIIENIGIMPGSGGSLVSDIINRDIDLYVTGDIKYHDAFEARSSGLKFVDIGHFCSEKIFLEFLKCDLQDYLTKVGEKKGISIYCNEMSPIKLF